MKLSLVFLLVAGICVAFVAAAPKKNKGGDDDDKQWIAFVKMIYKQVCKSEPGENRCVELTKDTYKSVLMPYRPDIKAKCKEYKAAGKFWLHWPCIALIKTIPKDD
uniref:Venom polypeptide n=1 Tax=Dolopus genitalis TaxID=2488630 RepID=A0A3G5BIA8_DOLGE|nr:venom polypeptide [Dolopus genitalis]